MGTAWERCVDWSGSRPTLAPAARFAVLLRGINVGKAQRVAMADLRALLGELGYTDIRTLLNSGNALVIGPDVAPHMQARTVEDALRERFGFAVRVIVLTAEELRAIVRRAPICRGADNGARMMVHVLARPPGAAMLGVGT